VSAIRSDTGAAAEIVRLVLRGSLTLLLDYKLVCEYRDVALRAKHLSAGSKAAPEVEEFIDVLENVAVPVFVGVKHRPMSRDENDDMVLDLAINGAADVLVTNNLKHFARARDFGIRVLTPGQMLAELRKGRHRHEN
jgi:predicted nucleic acid-binding protein